MNKYIVIVLVTSLPIILASQIFQNAVPLEGNRNIERAYYSQKLDNFDELNFQYWAQSFLVNEEFAQGVANPPVFIYINGDWDTLEANTFLERGLIYDLARNESGILISLDFRFNGANVPTPQISRNNLQFYTTAQGIEDIAVLIRFIKTLVGFEQTKFVVYGSSYGGSVAVWLRQKYPELVVGAWGAAAPLNAKFDFDNFYTELGNVVRSISDTCFDIFKVGLDQADEKVRAGETAEVTRILNLCQDIENDNGSDFMFYYRFSEFVSVFFTNAARFLLQTTCTNINVPTLTELERLGLFMAGTQNGTCFDINFPQYIADLLIELPTNRARVALYQQCTEFGWFKSMNNDEDLFGHRLQASLLSSLCTVIFQIDAATIQSSVEAFNSKYLGQNPTATNVYFTHGDLNPWRFLGVQETTNENTAAVVIPDFGKLWELFSLSQTPGGELDAARQQAIDLIGLWLST